MGRKTFESIGRPLPNRDNVIVTRNQYYVKEGCIITHSLDEAISQARNNGDSEIFVIGGGQIYVEALPVADKIYLTQVKASLSGDVYFSELKKDEWIVVNQVDFFKDEKHLYDFSILEMERITNQP